MTNLSKTAAQIDAILQGNPDSSTKANFKANLGINDQLSMLRTYFRTVDGSVKVVGPCKPGDVNPVAATNDVYVPTASGTMTGWKDKNNADIQVPSDFNGYYIKKNSDGYSVEPLKALSKEIGRTLRLYNALDLSQVTWLNGGFANNGYNIDSYLYKARTYYMPINTGTYYVRVKDGYRFSCVEQDAGNSNLAADASLVGTYGESQAITVTRAYIRVQIVKWTDDAIDETVTFDVSDLSEILEIIQVLNKKDRISDLEDKVTEQETVTAARIAPGAVETDGIKGAAVTPDKLSESYVKTEENIVSVSGITSIPPEIENIKLLSSIGATAYLRGKNFYDTVWSTGGGVSLLNQNTNEVEVSVTSGVFRNTVLATKNLPIGTFTASIELEILTGSTAVTPILYLYRTGATPGSTASNMTYDSVSGKWKATITFTNDVAYDTRIEVQHSLGTSTDAYTCTITTQIEPGSGNSAIVYYVALDVVIAANVAQKVSNAGYLYAYGSDYTVYYSVTPIFKNESNTIVVDSDSMGVTGGSTNKPVGDTNSDTNFPAVLERSLTDGKKVVNNGVGGETSWIIAARHGGIPVKILPNTIPATTDATRVYLRGQEEDYFYTSGVWTYLEGNLSYNISPDVGVNPCYIAGVKGTLSRTLLTLGDPDPDTGETVQSSTYAYYFTRETAGEEVQFLCEKNLITLTSIKYRNDIHIFFMGQNDAPNHEGSYILQVGSFQRVRRMVDHCMASDKRFIVINATSGSDVSNAVIDQQYSLEFGKHYLNLRKFVCMYGLGIANSLGYLTFLGTDDNTYIGDSVIDPSYPTIQDSIDAGVIPRCFRIDGVHLNYYGHQIAAFAVKEKGVDLEYMS